MEQVFFKLAALAAKGKEYAETGEITDEARGEMMRESLKKIEAILREREKESVKKNQIGFQNHHSLLEQKRVRYQLKRKKKEYGLKRHRQRRVVGKRHRRKDRIWEKGQVLKLAQERFDELTKQS